MKSEEKAVYIKYRLDRANETLVEARTLYDANLLSGTINRIYYAMFYAVSALALSHGFSTSSHAQLRGYFNREFVKTGIVSVDLGKLYGDAFKYRTKDDYQDLTTFEQEKVFKMLENASKFVETISKIVRSRA
jgi:uncharacterized protein (UPF0332 family)